MAQKLSADVLQQMLDENYAKTEKRFESHLDDDGLKGESFSDKSYKVHVDLYDKLSVPLKRMQVDYVSTISEQCYKEKHMADDLPNLE